MRIPAALNCNFFRTVENHLFVITLSGDVKNRGGLHGIDTALNGCMAVALAAA